jgi:hypothetical protein
VKSAHSAVHPIAGFRFSHTLRAATGCPDVAEGAGRRDSPGLTTLKALIFTLAALLATSGNSACAADTPALSLAELAGRAELTMAWTGNGRDQLALAVTNGSDAAVSVAIPAGFIAVNQPGDNRVIVLRAAALAVAPGATATVTLPVAALATTNAFGTQPYRATPDAEPRLAELLKYLADQPDVPRPTAQLVALAILEDVTFPLWQQFLAPQRTGKLPGQTHPTPLEVTQAIDALGLLRRLAPEKTFALATDAELKFRALRNPWCRAKATQLYGIALPTSDGAVPPDLGQLLHLKPGDNCPVCRQRSEMQKPGVP